MIIIIIIIINQTAVGVVNRVVFQRAEAAAEEGEEEVVVEGEVVEGEESRIEAAIERKMPKLIVKIYFPGFFVDVIQSVNG